MVYLGGLVVFAASASRRDPDIPRRSSGRCVPSGGFRTTFIDYGTRPLVGVESRIRMTSHMRLMPGAAVAGLGDGWLLRPYRRSWLVFLVRAARRPRDLCHDVTLHQLEQRVEAERLLESPPDAVARDRRLPLQSP